ncbi:MAG: molybdate ABC transporter substrate-binding protein [Planctomycetota bacterium]
MNPRLRPVVLLVALAACSRPLPRAVRVGAASSLREALMPSATGFDARNIPVSVNMTFEASSTLSRQVEAGAEYDVVLCADAESLDRLGSRVVETTRRVFLTNRLALLGPQGTLALDGIPATTKVAIAGPEVPAGKAWRKYLEGSGRLAGLEARFVIADSVRAALALFESGAVDYTLVYATDAKAAKRAHAAWTPPDGPVTEYVAAVVAGRDSAEARTFVGWLGSAGFQEDARKRGFGIPPK